MDDADVGGWRGGDENLDEETLLIKWREALDLPFVLA